jgi:hypothetical protein
MATRPCKPNTEMQWLWRALLPDTPFPGCGVPEAASTPTDANGADDRANAPVHADGERQLRQTD